MTEHSPPEHLADLSDETREFLSTLSKEDIDTLKKGLPTLRAILGFSIVVRWIAITAAGLLVGTVMMGDAIAKIFTWLRTP